MERRSLVRAGRQAFRIGDNALFGQALGQTPAQPDHKHSIGFSLQGWTATRARSGKPHCSICLGLGIPCPHPGDNHGEAVAGVFNDDSRALAGHVPPGSQY
jgi:hypothetical protein